MVATRGGVRPRRPPRFDAPSVVQRRTGSAGHTARRDGSGRGRGRLPAPPSLSRRGRFCWICRRRLAVFATRVCRSYSEEKGGLPRAKAGRTTAAAAAAADAAGADAAAAAAAAAAIASTGWTAAFRWAPRKRPRSTARSPRLPLVAGTCLPRTGCGWGAGRSPGMYSTYPMLFVHPRRPILRICLILLGTVLHGAVNPERLRACPSGRHHRAHAASHVLAGV